MTVRSRPILDRTSIGKTYLSTENTRLLEKREKNLYFLIGSQPGRYNQSISTLVDWAGWPMSRSVHHFLPENLSFSVFLSSNTLARSLGKLICQFWNDLTKVHLIKLGFWWKCNFNAYTEFLKMREKIWKS